MSVATASQTIQFFSKSGTYTAYISCNKGDFYQDYNPRDGGSITFSPNYANMDPKCRLTLKVYSSRVQEIVSCHGLEVKIGATTVQWSNVGGETISSGSLSGFLRMIEPVNDGDPYELEVLCNPVEVMGTASFVLTMTTNVYSASSGVSEPISAHINCAIQKSGGTSYRAVIYEAPTVECPQSFYHIEYPGQKVRLGVKVYNGEEDITGSCNYRWYMQDPTAAGGWRYLNINMPYAEIQEEWVETYACIKVEAISGGNVLATDVQGIWDAQDPYMVRVGADSELSFTEGDTDKVITFRPYVTTAGEGEPMPQYDKYSFMVINSEGGVMNDDYETKQTIHYPALEGEGWEMGYGYVEQNGASVELIITAHES